MYKKRVLLAALAALTVLSACAGRGPGGGSASQGGEPPAETGERITCRIVSADGAELLLAEQADASGAGQFGSPGVYRLDAAALEIRVQDASQGAGWREAEASVLESGQLVDVAFGGSVEETYPAQLVAPTCVTVLDAGFDGLCALYLQVLEDLWEVDPALSGGLTELGVDLSATRLPEAEQAAAAWAFGQRHGLVPLTGTYEELAEQGYIDRERLQWVDGCLFSITEEPDAERGAVTFDAQKWRSGIGAYLFCECTARQDADGRWSGYTVGSEAIA